ncbi:hypothetical protein DEA98_16635 [Brucella pseudogrignonensis]|nr:hypothetical protein [Brucella pseudogrignonensis]
MVSTKSPVSALPTFNACAFAQNDMAMIRIQATQYNASSANPAIATIAAVTKIIVAGIVAVTTPAAIATFTAAATRNGRASCKVEGCYIAAC